MKKRELTMHIFVKLFDKKYMWVGERASERDVRLMYEEANRISEMVIKQENNKPNFISKIINLLR